MPDPMTFHIVRLGDLRDPALYAQWDDPDRIAPLTPEKRRTLLSCPCASSDNDPVQIIALQGRSPIGRIDLIPGRLIVRGQPTPIGWGSNLSVPEKHRHTLAGAFLVMRACALYPNTGANGPSRMAVPLYEKLKFAALPLERSILLRHSRAIIEKKIGTGPHTSILSALADAALATHRAFSGVNRAANRSSLHTEHAIRMPADLNARLAASTEPVHVWRSAEWINWVLDSRLEPDEPGRPPFRRDLYLLKSRTGETVGYFITKLRFYPVASAGGYRNVLLGSLQDWQLFEPVTNEQTIALLAARELAAQGADAVEACLPPDPASASLRRFGFVRVGVSYMMVKAAPSSPLNQPDLLKPDSWRLRLGDADNLLA